MKKSNTTTSAYAHILTYTGLFGGVQGLTILLGMVRTKLVAILLGPAGVGLISLFNSTLTLLANATNLGLAMSAVRNLSEAYERGYRQSLLHAIGSLRQWTLLTALVGTLAGAVLSTQLSRFAFGDEHHRLSFILLSPIVGLTALTASETAILKATRQLRSLARLSIRQLLLSLLLSVPLYYFFRQAAIVPSLLVVAVGQMLLTVSHSFRQYPPRWTWCRQLLAGGSGMVRLGLSFVLAGILGSGADLLVRSFLNTQASIEVVGLFNAGYMLTMAYASTIFTAMETDYFPRLSAVAHRQFTTNHTVNRQAEVSLLLVAPVLVAFLIGLPVLLPLLYSGQFLPVLGMVQVMVLAIYLRALYLPVEYLSLAKGDARSYLFLEAVYDLLLVGLIIVGFRWNGLLGTGIGITLASLINLTIVLVYTRRKYNFRLSGSVVRYALMQAPILAAAYLLTLTATSWTYWLVGLSLTALSTALSVNILRRKTSLWNSLTAKVYKKIKHA